MLNRIKDLVFGSILTGGLTLGTIVIDKDYCIIFWNGWMEKNTGVKERDVLGQNIFELYPDIRDRGKEKYVADCVENMKPVFLSPFFHDYLIPIEVVKGGEATQMRQNVKIYPAFDEEQTLGAVIIIEDLTEQIYHEQEISRLNQILRAIRDVNQLITRVTDQEELLKRACKILFEGLGHSFVWVGLIQEGSFHVKPAAYAGLGDEMLADIKITWDDSEYGMGITGTAIKTGKTQVVNWVQKDPSQKASWELDNGTDWRSACSLPLKSYGNVMGAFTVYSQEINVFHGEVLELLEEVTEDISFAIESLKERQKRQRAEAALAEEKERLAVTLLSIGDAVIATDQEGKVVLVNKVAEELTGWTQAEANGRPLEEVFCIINEYTRKCCEDPVKKVMEAGVVIGLANHTVLISRDGTERIIADSGAPIHDAEDEIIGVILVFRDVTEARQMEEKLRESEERLRLAMEAVNDGLYDWNIETGEVYFSPGYYTMLGYEPHEMPVSRETWESLLHPDDKEREMAVIEEYVQMKRDSHEGEYRLKAKDGTWQWILGRGKVVERDPSGEYVRVIGTHVNITERKRMEEELQKVQKLESVGVLAGGIAHDLNNLMVGVMGNISLARMHDNIMEKDRDLLRAEEASARVGQLTHRLLTFAKGGAPVVKKADIGSLLRDSASFVLSGSSVMCEFSIPDDLCLVEIDEGQINQVINNLLINARQAMPGGGTIRISAESTSISSESVLPLEAGAYVRMSFQDEGTGIPPDLVNKIFDPFFTTKQEGSGLGLATSYSIIEKHNGHITVESQMGVGATFHIYLPAAPDGVLTGESGEEEMLIMGSGRVLLMDDEKDIRDLIPDMLNELGYEATTAVDGAEALELYKEAMELGKRFDAVILDLTVRGGMGGREAMQKLMAMDPEAKVIVSSGYANDPVMSDFDKYGFKDAIAKPYKAREISEVLHRIIAGAD